MNALYKSLGEQVFNILRERIITNEIKPGTVLQIDKMASDFGVSTTPIREALMKLEAAGLVTITRNRRATVSGLDRKQIEDTLEFRRLLETYGAKYAVKHMSDEQIDDLESYFYNSYLDPQDKDRILSFNKEMHNVYIRPHIKNDIIKKTLEDLSTHAMRIFYHAQDNMDPSEMAQVMQEGQKDILSALKNRDENEIQKATHRHFSNTMEKTLKSLDAEAPDKK